MTDPEQKPPPQIYLQWDAGCSEMTWCDDKINDWDQLYIRDDLVSTKDAELAQLRKALTDIARQHLSHELDTEGCFETGYDEIVKVARAALGNEIIGSAS